MVAGNYSRSLWLIFHYHDIDDDADQHDDDEGGDGYGGDSISDWEQVLVEKQESANVKKADGPFLQKLSSRKSKFKTQH